jgi:hypothetical protein
MTDFAPSFRRAWLRRLLDEVSAGAREGWGAFRQLPLEKLLGGELYGVGLITPSPADGGASGVRSAAAAPRSCTAAVRVK